MRGRLGQVARRNKITKTELQFNQRANPQWRGLVYYNGGNPTSYFRSVDGTTKEAVQRKLEELMKEVEEDYWDTIEEKIL